MSATPTQQQQVVSTRSYPAGASCTATPPHGRAKTASLDGDASVTDSVGSHHWSPLQIHRPPVTSFAPHRQLPPGVRTPTKAVSNRQNEEKNPKRIPRYHPSFRASTPYVLAIAASIRIVDTPYTSKIQVRYHLQARLLQCAPRSLLINQIPLRKKII